MKTTFTAALAACAIAGSASAGGMAEPIEMAPVEIIEDTGGSSSSAGLIIPLILIALIAAAVSSSDSGGSESTQASDMRLKDNITRVGTAANGLPLYHFSYRGSSLVFEGVMAQDVLMHTPDAVVARTDGPLAVDYGMLGLQMRLVD